MAKNVVELLITARDLASGVLEGVEDQVQRTSSSTRREWQALTSASGVALAGLSALAGSALGAATGMVTLAGRLEQSKIAFETMLGSAQAADDFLRDLADFAAATPFDFPGLQDSSRLLLAFGFQAESVIPIVGTLGDATSALGGGTDTLEGVVRALGQMQTKGKVATQELLQLAERGIPVFDILKEKLNLTGEQVADIGTLGISSSTAITAILEGLGERFGGAMQKQSRTILGLWSTVKDSVSLIATDLGAKLSESLDLTGLLERLTSWLDTLRERVATIDLKQMWEDGKAGVVTFAGALVGMALPAVINLVRNVMPLVTRLGALALAGALVVDVAQKLGIDFGKLTAPSGALARLGSMVMGLLDIFDGLTSGIAALIRATVQSFGDWVTFFQQAAAAVSEIVTRIGEDALTTVEALSALQAYKPWEALAKINELRDRNRERGPLFQPLVDAWMTSFQGFSAEIEAQFGEAGLAMDRGWQRIVAGWTGNLDEATTQLVTTVSDAVAGGAKKIIDWSSLLGDDATPALLDVADASGKAAEGITTSAEEASKAAVTWRDALQTIGAAVGTHLRDALGVDQPDGPLVELGKSIVANLAAGFEQAFPSFGQRLAAAVTAGAEAAQWLNRPTYDDAAAQAAIDARRAAGQAAFDEAPGSAWAPARGLPAAEGGVLWNTLAALVKAGAPAEQVERAVTDLTEVLPLSVTQIRELTGGVVGFTKSTREYAVEAEAAARAVAEAFDENAPLWQPEGGLPPAWHLRAGAAATRWQDLTGTSGAPAGALRPSYVPTPAMLAAAQIAADTLHALVETGAGFTEVLAAVESLTAITPLSVTQLDELTGGLYSVATAAENAAARADAAWAAWADTRAFDEAPGTAWRPEGGLPSVPTTPTPRDLGFGASTGPSAVVAPDRSQLPQEQLQEILKREMEARQAVVDELLQMSTEKGPLANFSARLLSAASEAVPAFGAALDGFVQAGPLGAVIAFFSELLLTSEPMMEAFEMINQALAPLGELLGRIIAPALKLLGTVVGWVVDGLVAVYNFLLGWLFGRVERDKPADGTPAPQEPPKIHSDAPPTRREMDFGRVSPGVQLAVATPLVEAAQLQLTAGTLFNTAATTFAGAVAQAATFYSRLAEDGISVRVAQASQSAQSGRRTAYLR